MKLTVQGNEQRRSAKGLVGLFRPSERRSMKPHATASFLLHVITSCIRRAFGAIRYRKIHALMRTARDHYAGAGYSASSPQCVTVAAPRKLERRSRAATRRRDVELSVPTAQPP